MGGLVKTWLSAEILANVSSFSIFPDTLVGAFRLVVPQVIISGMTIRILRAAELLINVKCAR